jgi:hypothetical protein
MAEEWVEPPSEIAHYAALINVRFDDLQRQITQVATNLQQQIDRRAADRTREIDELVGAIKTTEETRWQAHTGENGIHEQLATQRREDISRAQTLLTVTAGIITSIGGVAVGYLYVHQDGPSTYVGVVIFVAAGFVAALTAFGRVRMSMAFGRVASKVYRGYRRVKRWRRSD